MAVRNVRVQKEEYPEVGVEEGALSLLNYESRRYYYLTIFLFVGCKATKNGWTYTIQWQFQW